MSCLTYLKASIKIGYHFYLTVVVNTHSKTVKNLFKPFDFKHQFSIFVKFNTTSLIDFFAICMLVKSLDSHAHSNHIPDGIRFCFPDRLILTDNWAINTFICYTLVASKRIGSIEVMYANSYPNCRRVTCSLVFLGIFLRQKLHKICSLNHRPFKNGGSMAEISHNFIWICQCDIWRFV